MLLVEKYKETTYSYLNSVEKFNTQEYNTSWEIHSNLNIARSNFGVAISLKNRIYIFGGENKPSSTSSILNSLKSVEMLDLNDTNPTWKEENSYLNQDRCNFGYITDDKYDFYIIGGHMYESGNTELVPLDNAMIERL